MLATITRHGMLVVQSETEVEDFAVEQFITKHEAAFVQTPAMFCFDHGQDFNAIVSRLNAETLAARETATIKTRESVAAESAADKKQKQKGRRNTPI
jgi:hypothetical protein